MEQNQNGEREKPGNKKWWWIHSYYKSRWVLFLPGGVDKLILYLMHYARTTNLYCCISENTIRKDLGIHPNYLMVYLYLLALSGFIVGREKGTYKNQKVWAYFMAPEVPIFVYHRAKRVWGKVLHSYIQMCRTQGSAIIRGRFCNKWGKVLQRYTRAGGISIKSVKEGPPKNMVETDKTQKEAHIRQVVREFEGRVQGLIKPKDIADFLVRLPKVVWWMIEKECRKKYPDERSLYYKAESIARNRIGQQQEYNFIERARRIERAKKEVGQK